MLRWEFARKISVSAFLSSTKQGSELYSYRINPVLSLICIKFATGRMTAVHYHHSESKRASGV